MARILVVDDDVSIRNSLKKALTLAGHEVVEAENGEDALVTYRAAGPDLVMTDVYMPGTDGIEGTIRMLMEFPQAKVIVMTGGGWAEKDVILDNAQQLGAVGTLAKPFSVQEVMDAVRSALDR